MEFAELGIFMIGYKNLYDPVSLTKIGIKQSDEFSCGVFAIAFAFGTHGRIRRTDERCIIDDDTVDIFRI